MLIPLSYLEPPTFVQKIENCTTILESSAVFQCAISGSDPITVSWIKGDKIIEPDDNTHITFENNIATLYIKTVDAGHPGRYTCQASNESGTEKCFASLIAQGR